MFLKNKSFTRITAEMKALVEIYVNEMLSTNPYPLLDRRCIQNYILFNCLSELCFLCFINELLIN